MFKKNKIGLKNTTLRVFVESWEKLNLHHHLKQTIMKIIETVKVKTPSGDKFLPKCAIIEGVVVGVTFKNKRKDGTWLVSYKPYFNKSLLHYAPDETKAEVMGLGAIITIEQVKKYKEFMFTMGGNANGYFVEEVKKTYSGYNSTETQTCWECGCQFTYSQCKRGGGDWKDSYCGC